MFYIYGTKQFDIKKHGYKNTNCEHCDMTSLCTEWRWSSWAHLFFIPLLPLGYDSSFTCNACGQEPKTHSETSIVLKVVILLILLLFAIPVYFGLLATMGMIPIDSAPAETPPALSPVISWLILAVVTFFLYKNIKWITSHKKNLLAKRRLSLLPLNNTSECEVCDGNLSEHKLGYQCSDCKCIAYSEVKHDGYPE